MKTVFSGENGVFEYLNPSSHCTPLVELPSTLNPYRKDGVRIFAKLVSHLPLMNIKSIPMFHALNNTSIEGTHTLVENSSGNTAYSLTVLAKLFGIQTMHALVSHEITKGKLRLLQLFGADITINKENICPNPADKNNGIQKAKQLGTQKNRLNIGQYDNPLNIQGYQTTTAPEIYKQMQRDVQIFAASLGTTGSLIGNITYLKEKNPNIVSLGIIRKANNPVPGPRTKTLLQHIAFPREQQVDHLIEVGSKESYLQSLHLLRSGILVGPSSGLVLAGIFQFLKQQKKSKQRDNYRNNKGEIRIVFLCGDTPFPYIEEYFNYIPTTYFSKIQHAEHLPFYKELQQSKTKRKYTISCSQLFQKAFIQQKGKLSLSKHRTIYDIRTLQEYQEYHIPGAIHIPTSSECLHQIHRHPKQCTCIVCRYGAKSSDLIAYQKNLNTCYSLKGGMLEWSTKHYPKQQHPSCLLPNNTSNGLQTM